MFQVLPCCSRPSMCGTLICMRVHSGMASVWVQVVASRRSHHHPPPVTLSLHLVTSLPLPSWARDFPSEKSLLSRSHSTFHIRVTLSRHALLSSQITARQSGRSAAHPAPLKGTGEKSANPLCSPPPSPSVNVSMWCGGLSFISSTFTGFASQILLISSVRNQ